MGKKKKYSVFLVNKKIVHLFDVKINLNYYWQLGNDRKKECVEWIVAILTWLIQYYLMLANWKNFHWNSCSNLFAESVPKFMRYWKYLCCLKLDHAKYSCYANTRRNYHSFRNWNLLAASRWTNKFVFTKVISERTSQSFWQLKASQMVPLLSF